MENYRVSSNDKVYYNEKAQYLYSNFLTSYVKYIVCSIYSNVYL